MIEILYMFFGYIFSEFENLFLGGVVVVGVVIALMGLIKNLPFIRALKSDTVRKVVLAWLSIVLTVGVTVISMYVNQFKQDHFIMVCIFNSVGTVLLYWVYENTAIRNFVEWVGKMTIYKIFHRKPKSIEEARTIGKEIEKEVESLLGTVNSESEDQRVSRYKDDDLKNL